jgi:hypothetical protein
MPIEQSTDIDITLTEALAPAGIVPLAPVAPGTTLIAGLSALRITGAPGPLTAHFTVTPPPEAVPLVGVPVLLSPATPVPLLALPPPLPWMLGLAIAEGLPVGAHLTGRLVASAPLF